MTRRRIGLLAGAVIVLVGTGLLAAARTPYRLEATVGRWAYDLPDPVTTPLEVVMGLGTLTAVILVTAGLVVAGGYRAAGAALLAGVGGWLASSALKDGLDRARPTLATLGRVPRALEGSAAWPSGHATVAAALATVVALTVARGRVGRGVVIAAAALTAVARVHRGAHWALDVLGGAALGVAAALLAVALLRPT